MTNKLHEHALHADTVDSPQNHVGKRDVAAEESAVKTWRHKKRGTTYLEIGRGEIQTSTGSIVDGSAAVIYMSQDGKIYIREEGEFEDGRFERESPKI